MTPRLSFYLAFVPVLVTLGVVALRGEPGPFIAALLLISLVGQVFCDKRPD